MSPELEEFVEPSPRARRMLVAVLAVHAAIAIGIGLSLPWIAGQVRGLAPCAQLDALRGLLYGAAALSACAAPWALWLGLRSFMQQRVPPVGTWVLRRTRIIRGRRARLIAALLTGAGIALLAAAAHLVTLTQRLTAELGPRLC
jgi:hypothetical protein